MLKKKNIKNIGRIISFILILSVFSGSSLAYGSSIEVDSVNVEYVQSESFIYAEDLLIPVADISTSAQVQDFTEEVFAFSAEEININEENMVYSVGVLELSVSEYLKRDSNEISEEIKEEYINRASQPDLLIYSISAYNSHPFTALGTAQVSIIIVNFGDAAAGASTSGVFLDNQLLHTYSVPSLPVGYGYEVILSITGVSAGSHVVKAQADYYGVIAESNESNNIGTMTFSWTGSPDLIVSSFTAATLAPVVGANLTFSYSIANIGNANANGTFLTAVLVNGNSVGTLSIQGLGAQMIASGSFTLAFPNNNTYIVQLRTDSTNVIIESNENNNYSSTIQIKPKIAEQVTVTGRLQYRSYDNFGSSSTLHNLSNYEVKIYDDNLIGSTLKGTAVTDSNGYFSVTINNETGIFENGSDLFLAVPMDNSYITISSFTYLSMYQFETEVFKDYQHSLLALGTMTLDASETMKGALNIYHWIKEAKDYYQSNASSLGKTYIIWDVAGNEGSYFNGSSIFLNGAAMDHYDSTVIVHEYGHYIMDYKNVNPTNAGGEHTFTAPSLYPGTAYSEAYASFIALQVRNKSTYEDWDAFNNYFGADFETLTFISSSGNFVVPRRSDFHENAMMELFTGGAMLDFADSAVDGVDTYNGGFNDVNDIVMSQRLENSIEFYDAYMNNTNSYNKVLAWEIFNQNHSAFDYILPTVSITGNETSGYTAMANDDVGISKLEWYLDGSLVGFGTTYTPTSNLSPGVHSVQVRAYDYEGDVRGTYYRRDLNGNLLRTAAYSSASAFFSTRGSSAGFSFDYQIEIPEEMDFESVKTFEISNSLQSSKQALNNRTIAISGNNDLYLVGKINGAVDSINLINEYNRIEACIEGVFDNEFVVMRNIPSGEYYLEINTISDIQEIPYVISVFAVPALPKLEIPKAVGLSNTLEISNSYSNRLHVFLNEREYSIEPYGSSILALDEGENKLRYYSENKYGKSEIVENTIFCDTIAPNVSIVKAISNGDVLIVTGEISEYIDKLYINSTHVMLGEFNMPGEAITFDFIVRDINISELNIDAEDALGNRFTLTAGLIW